MVMMIDNEMAIGGQKHNFNLLDLRSGSVILLILLVRYGSFGDLVVTYYERQECCLCKKTRTYSSAVILTG